VRKEAARIHLGRRGRQRARPVARVLHGSLDRGRALLGDTVPQRGGWFKLQDTLCTLSSPAVFGLSSSVSTSCVRIAASSRPSHQAFLALLRMADGAAPDLSSADMTTLQVRRSYLSHSHSGLRALAVLQLEADSTLRQAQNETPAEQLSPAVPDETQTPCVSMIPVDARPSPLVLEGALPGGSSACAKRCDDDGCVSIAGALRCHRRPCTASLAADGRDSLQQCAPHCLLRRWRRLRRARQVGAPRVCTKCART
jgi:hypothetical protein